MNKDTYILETFEEELSEEALAELSNNKGEDDDDELHE